MHEFDVDAKNPAFKTKAKAWTFEAKAIKCGLEASQGQCYKLHHCKESTFHLLENVHQVGNLITKIIFFDTT